MPHYPNPNILPSILTIIQGVDFANYSSTANTTSPLFGMIDTESIVVAGHSMGAMDSIMAALRSAKGEPRLPTSNLKLMITQHPFVCGPFGPPPWPHTWLESDLRKIATMFPILFTTATNDAVRSHSTSKVVFNDVGTYSRMDDTGFLARTTHCFT